ncbi:alpha/beta-hydrolase [Rhizopogon vinicolor AM-OR11-026]|uniref:sn-1-specific diacylglycerol lipase n=1 Tax=Rhizopogon vinicolor AM-OR11-026 TaxID=1314800 RepID=A0A1B7N6Y3_9AGAM|nr:alpha/beta-hydrolase [Rhizopogon vinicolor AM-OR11-026]
MVYEWQRFGRRSLDLATAATSLTFTAVKGATRLGFSVTRDAASGVVGMVASTLDHAVFGGSEVAAPVLEGAVATAITFAERLTLAPIYVGEYISSASLRAAYGSIDILSIIFPGSSEASFSLASFIDLVKREWDLPGSHEHIPGRKYGITEVARALVAWVALQGVTHEWQEQNWFPYLREIQFHDPSTAPHLKRIPSRVRVTSDVIFPGHRGQLISADIGEAPPTSHTRSRSPSVLSRLSISSMSSFRWKDPHIDVPQKSMAELKTNLRRFSKMVLAGYGGASLLFFGVPLLPSSRNSKPPTSSNERDAEEAQLQNAVNAAEDEIEGSSSPCKTDNLEYSWWDILMGKHDKEIFERSVHGEHVEQPNVQARARATAVVGIERQMPRFWVLTDHDRHQVVLVLRGTMSLNELAVDLTCEPVEFEPASTTSPEGAGDSIPFPHGSTRRTSRRRLSILSTISHPKYHVHGGMLRMARVMGEIGKPVHLAVMDALTRNPGYELVLCGHSLGAGVAVLLAMMWADPATCLTVPSSGLPPDRSVSVYCIGPPCLTDAALSRLASKLVTSFVCSDDIVSRLSLGSVRDIRNAALWLCDANDRNGGEEGYSVITNRIRRWKAGDGSPDDFDWFLSMRKTLEANMRMADLFPPGRVLWAVRDCDLHPSHQSQQPNKDPDQTLRLFEVLDIEKVFSQVVFSKNMLGSHMPHRYDQVLHELL